MNIPLTKAVFGLPRPILRRWSSGVLAMIASSSARWGVSFCVMVASFGLAGCQEPSIEPVPDEAMVRARAQGKTTEQAALDYVPKRKVDYFPAMDAVGQKTGNDDWPDQLLDAKRQGDQIARPERTVAPLPLTESEFFGRNSWMIWCAGNEGFWDWLANNSFGSSDVLKVLDSRNRSTLFRDAGLINEPDMTAAGAPGEYDFGLWLSQPADPATRQWRQTYLKTVFDRQLGRGPSSYEGDARDVASYGADNRAEADAKYPPPEIYGLSSGVIGLRLFPNPKFDAEANKAWDADRYMDDEDYYTNPKLVRPFRVGMSCAFCHASFHPLKPPRDRTDPEWENISGNIGAQYLRIRSVFGNLMDKNSFVYHVLDSQPPGTIDTSLIPSDNINNTNAMNSIFGVPQRVALSFKNPEETLSTASRSLPSLWTDREFAEGKVPDEYRKAIPELPESNGNPRHVPRILFDGADTIGAYGALARVYLNIGSYYEQWIQLHRPLIGFQPQRPFKIVDCEKYSVSWNATQHRVGPMRDYFLRITPPMRLLDADSTFDRKAPIDEAALKAQALAEKQDPASRLAAERARRVDVSKLRRGREVFARNCIVCHSSIQPPERHKEMSEWAARGEFWDHDPGKWLRDDAYMTWALKAVETPEFWNENFLSTDYRIPINLVRTNSARAMATNAMDGHMWQDFSSLSYRSLPSVGSIPYFNPYLGNSGGQAEYTPRHKAPEGVADGGGGPGFYRVPTLISIWTSAPLLHNNSLGTYNRDPSVDGRLAAFDDAIRKLLWPEKRLESSSYNDATADRLKRDHGLIWRTPNDTYLSVPAQMIPSQIASFVRPAVRLLDLFPWLADLRWLVLPALLLVVSVVVLWRASRPKTRVLLGYLSMLAALVIGFAIYFFNGRLGDIRLGPIPAGTPVNLLANINPEADPAELKEALHVTWSALSDIRSRQVDAEESQRIMRETVAPALMKVSKCPDFVMDQGHYFEWFKTMSDDDKNALIELLKTF